MKKFKILSLFLASLAVLVLAIMAFGGEQNVKLANDVAYDFPIKPGTDAWKKFTGHDEMLVATQIPEDVLKSMSTRALIETCLNYPLVGEITVHNSLQQGLEALISGFNGLQELLKREDAGVELLAQYRLVNKKIVQDINDIDSKKSNTAHFFEHTFIEMLLAQSSIQASMSMDEEKSLAKESLSDFRLAQSRPDIYSFASLQSEVLVMKKVLEREDGGLQVNGNRVVVGDSEMDLFKNTDQIVSQAENFISK
jgi:hypothetical protein